MQKKFLRRFGLIASLISLWPAGPWGSCNAGRVSDELGYYDQVVFAHRTKHAPYHWDKSAADGRWSTVPDEPTPSCCLPCFGYKVENITATCQECGYKTTARFESDGRLKVDQEGGQGEQFNRCWMRKVPQLLATLEDEWGKMSAQTKALITPYKITDKATLLAWPKMIHKLLSDAARIDGDGKGPVPRVQEKQEEDFFDHKHNTWVRYERKLFDGTTASWNMH